MMRIFLLVGYSRKTLNHLERITLCDLTHMMIMTDLVAINVETLRIYTMCSLEKKFTELILMNPWMIFYLTISEVDSCHACVFSPLI